MAKRALLGVGLVVMGLVWSSTVNAADSFRLNATLLNGPLLLVGRYHISNPSYCLATKPSYAAKDYARWVSARCAPYTVQRADFVVTVRHNRKRVMAESLRTDGAYGIRPWAARSVRTTSTAAR